MEGDLLRIGRHRATLAEVEETFVYRAPFVHERKVLWEAFSVYRSLIGRYLPSVRYWINGGFATHKAWAPPDDIDVCVIAPPADYEAAGPVLFDLFTDTGPPRVQPMSGLVDAFPMPGGLKEDGAYWYDLWSQVRGADGNRDYSRSKGFLEVMPDEHQ
ncbi:DUF6932 family protein [Litorihabitans aurantiacus]|uniref:Uncharacterized protein n=1 Tax=Litorihabitans aurantiacus TaxID=1930061 RepID=A0AA38CNY9_9MICO|nr:hypothetical protein [Litorihabitans aurantiacus]GMA31568.1 hypothetical protein GCM10025875_15600 [Litorihabitans aurantiacus]